jgi:hypothetical protein
MLVQPEPIRTARPRAATAHDTRTISGNLGCARPEKQTVEGRAGTAAGAAMGRDLSQTDRTTRDYGVYAGHRGGR